MIELTQEHEEKESQGDSSGEKGVQQHGQGYYSIMSRVSTV